MIDAISWLHTPNLSSWIDLVITKHTLKPQYVKFTQLWPLTVNCGFSVLSARFIIKLPKIYLLWTYVDQMIIQQRLNVLLQRQFYNIFTNVLSTIFTNVLSTFTMYWRFLEDIIQIWDTWKSVMGLQVRAFKNCNKFTPA